MKKLCKEAFFLVLSALVALAFCAALFGLSGLIANADAPTCRPTGTYADRNWGICNDSLRNHADFQEAWNFTRGSADIVIAVIDTGIDVEHPALKDRLVPGYDFVKDTSAMTDPNGHGTHVAGIIAAAAPGVKIMPVRYYVESDSGSVSLKRSVEAFEFAIAQKVQIINYSGGGPEADPRELAAMKKAREAGILVVAAAGNDGDQEAWFPAAYVLDNIISVGSSDIAGRRLRSSNWSPELVDLVAPGENIVSTLPRGKFGYMTGTSQAAPFVSAAAALVLSLRPKMKPHQVKAALLNSVSHRKELEGVVGTAGILNAAWALKLL